MVPADFWRAYAADTSVISGKEAYKFSHNERSLASGGNIKYDPEFQTYLFHYTRDGLPKDSQGNVYETLYSGGVLILTRDTPHNDVDGQRANDSALGSHTTKVKPFYDDATILREIRKFANTSPVYCEVDLNLSRPFEPVFNIHIGKFTGSGIWIRYTMLIRHDTFKPKVYTLSADAGSFAVAGTDADLSVNIPVPDGFTAEINMTIGGTFLFFTGATITLLESDAVTVIDTFSPTNSGPYNSGNPAAFSIDEDSYTNVGRIQLDWSGLNPAQGGSIDESGLTRTGGSYSNQSEFVGSGIASAISADLGEGNIEINGDIVVNS